MNVALATGSALLTVGAVAMLFADALGRDALVAQRDWYALVILAGAGVVGMLTSVAV